MTWFASLRGLRPCFQKELKPVFSVLLVEVELGSLRRVAGALRSKQLLTANQPAAQRLPDGLWRVLLTCWRCQPL